MANPNQFARRMFRLSKGVRQGAARSIRNSGIGAIQEVTKRTPVDTTLARSNWLASVGGPDLSERPLRSASDVISEARASLNLAFIESIILAKDLVEIHIANGGKKVPYLEWLNRGSSRQAPAGFVKTAVEVGAKRNLLRTRLLLGTRGTRAKGL